MNIAYLMLSCQHFSQSRGIIAAFLLESIDLMLYSMHAVMQSSFLSGSLQELTTMVFSGGNRLRDTRPPTIYALRDHRVESEIARNTLKLWQCDRPNAADLLVVEAFSATLAVAETQRNPIAEQLFYFRAGGGYERIDEKAAGREIMAYDAGVAREQRRIHTRLPGILWYGFTLRNGITPVRSFGIARLTTSDRGKIQPDMRAVLRYVPDGGFALRVKTRGGPLFTGEWLIFAYTEGPDERPVLVAARKARSWDQWAFVQLPPGTQTDLQFVHALRRSVVKSRCPERLSYPLRGVRFFAVRQPGNLGPT
jgi:hypothetical protein